jgi:putative ATP-binding cassette transporter
VQDYQRQELELAIISASGKAEITIDNLVNNQSPHQPEIVNKVSFTTGLSHQEMQKLTNYSLGTVRTKASKGQSITTQDGSTYSYNKDPNVLKWVQV